MAVTYEAIATTTVSGTSTTTVTFSSLPSTYTDIVYSIMTPTISGVNTYIRFNGDSGSNYSGTQLGGDGSSPYSFRVANDTQAFAGISDGTAAIRGNIMNYANSTTYKTVLSRGGGNRYVDADVSLWRNTAAITSISFLAFNWADGSVITIYGIKAA